MTIEEPVDLKAALARVGEDDTVVIDCLTLWTSNMMLEGFDQESILDAARNDAERAAARSGSTIVVTNEVGSGVHPPTELGRAFQDVLGRVNVAWSSVADRSYLVVAGKVLSLQDPPA
jgi:adenosylcobinamide kinase/adenosylcobinamide-phosphate guanylyltransferase